MPKNPEEKILFALSPSDVGPILTLGIPKGAWDYMKDGRTHTFDLTSIGVPIKLMLFGAESHDVVYKTLAKSAADAGIPFLDERQGDYSIKAPPPSDTDDRL
jgi:hypothetical protein